MKIDFIPFQMGMPYEYLEFDLEPVNSDFKVPYDKYVYFKNDITELFGLGVQHIYLYFTWDILFKVEVIFKPNNSVQEFIHLATQLENKYGKQPLTSSEDLMRLFKAWKDPKKHLIIEHHFKLNVVSLLLVDKKDMFN